MCCSALPLSRSTKKTNVGFCYKQPRGLGLAIHRRRHVSHAGRRKRRMEENLTRDSDMEHGVDWSVHESGDAIRVSHYE